KALSYSLEDNDQNDLDELILTYIAKKEEIRNTQTQQIPVKEYQASGQIKLSDGRVYDYDDIEDPVAHKGKGRPPYKRLKAFNEETNMASSSSSKAQHDNVDNDGETRRRCGLCHKTGHYAP
ncbi:21369_t:CDS:1, partial [Dentiscutata erythropus]